MDSVLCPLISIATLRGTPARIMFTAQGAKVTLSPVASGSGITQNISETHHHHYVEPTQETASQAESKQRMREQLYREIARNNHSIVVRIHVATSIQGIQQGLSFRFTNNLVDINFDIWNCYNDEKR